MSHHCLKCIKSSPPDKRKTKFIWQVLLGPAPSDFYISLRPISHHLLVYRPSLDIISSCCGAFDNAVPPLSFSLDKTLLCFTSLHNVHFLRIYFSYIPELNCVISVRCPIIHNTHYTEIFCIYACLQDECLWFLSNTRILALWGEELPQFFLLVLEPVPRTVSDILLVFSVF